MEQIIITKPSYQECYIGTTIISGSILFNSKLFHNDKASFNYNELLDYESNRNNYMIGGVLKLTGITEYKNAKTHKCMYEFTPINWRYPKFLVPSEIKNNLIKKKEKIIDYFVVIQFKEWSSKYPIGTINRCIGPIDNLINKYEVLFYYYPENPYILNKLTSQQTVYLTQYNILDVIHIISIDPIGCKDIDDAISYDPINNKIGIHIADVNYVIKNQNIINSKYSTIYAPHKIINMLPDELAFNHCSLIENYVRPVISCWIDIENMTFRFKREFIKVRKNYSYDEFDVEFNKLRKNKDNLLNILFEFSQLLNSQFNYVETVKSSHEMVEVYMIFLNNKVAEILQEDNIIYRNQLPCEFAEYSYENKGHSYMKLKHYTHFTSPIRRAVDQYVHQVLINKFFDKIEINKLDIDKVNKFELELKKVNLQWNYLKVSDKIMNGELYTVQFVGFNKNYIEFKYLEHNVLINNKLLFSIINENTVCIQNKEYELNKNYELPLYVINNTKNLYFPKIIIKFI